MCRVLGCSMWRLAAASLGRPSGVPPIGWWAPLAVDESAGSAVGLDVVCHQGYN